MVSHASSAGGRLHAGATRKQLGDGEAKQRRVAYGSDVIKDELRKGAGGPAGAGPEQVGDSSEDEDEDTVPAARLHSITRYNLNTCGQLQDMLLLLSRTALLCAACF